MCPLAQHVLRFLLCASLPTLFFAASAPAQEAYYEVPATELKITEGRLPTEQQSVRGRQWRRVRAMVPWAVLDGEGAIYLGSQVGRLNATSARRRGDANAQHNSGAIAVCAPKGKDVTGSLYVPKSDLSGFTRVRFTIAASKATDGAKDNFYLTKEDHYSRLLSRGVPGSGWFRHQMRQAKQARTGTLEAEPISTTDQRRAGRPARGTQLEDTYQILSGGRAVSENLQLDRLLPVAAPQEPTVALDSLPTITVRKMDWKELTKGIDPKLDPTAAYVPADQHVLFFPTFQAVVTMVDEATLNGTPALQLVQPRSEDARSQERYERQLCLSLDVVARTLGDQTIKSVAVTGSDPYLRTGTDVAVLFEAKNRDVLTAFLAAKRLAAVTNQPGCEQVTGKVGDLGYTGAVSTDRSICSYVAVLDNIVVVTNSLAQLRRIQDVHSGTSAAVASLPEYRFFRARYQRDDPEETALLIVTDATIRRWCGPKWRIATSRRTRAAAILAEHQARHLDALVDGTAEPDLIHTKLHVPDLGTLKVTKTGIVSSTYGSLDFQTPISELQFTKVTQAEAESYRRWRNGYQRNWSQFFDPIATRFSIRKQRLAADMTVMPLIASSDYREFMQISSGAAIKPDTGDRHAGTLLHWALAVNVDSAIMRQAGNFVEGMLRSVKGSPFSWLGESIAVYVDEDPFWLELAKAEDKEDFLEEEYYRLPIALRAEVSSSFKLALFLTGVRGFIEQTSPGLTVWKTLKHNEQPYVKISAAEGRNRGIPEKLAIYYAATPEALVLTVNEDVLKRALDRQVAGKQTVASDGGSDDSPKSGKADRRPAAKKLRPWLGESMTLQAGDKFVGAFETIFRDEYEAVMQVRSWANIPILNEWKRRYPDRKPAKLHQTFWQTKLRCPGGGQYVWNPEFQTMESTVYGHPGDPKPGPASPEALRRTTFLNFGLTFENQGLRAIVQIDRRPK